MKKILNLFKALSGGSAPGEADRQEPVFTEPQHRAPLQEPSGHPAFQPVNDLEHGLITAARNADYRSQFTQFLLDSKLYFATPPSAEPRGHFVAEEDTQISLFEVDAPDGSRVPAAFTSPLRLSQLISEEAQYLEIRLRDLLEGTALPGLYLNPGHEYQAHFSAADLDGMMGRPHRYQLEEETQVLLGVPAEVPEEAVGRIQATLAADPRVEEAWFALAQWPGDRGFSFYIDLRSGEAPETLRDLIAALGEACMGLPHPVDIAVNAATGTEGTGIPLKTRELA